MNIVKQMEALRNENKTINEEQDSCCSIVWMWNMFWWEDVWNKQNTKHTKSFTCITKLIETHKTKMHAKYKRVLKKLRQCKFLNMSIPFVVVLKRRRCGSLLITELRFLPKLT